MTQVSKEEKKILYRYEIEYSNVDDETKVVLRELPVFRETEYTYFVGHQYQTSEAFGRKLKRVLKLKTYQNGYIENGKTTKRFAYLKKTDAMLNFKARTEKRISWFKYWIDECEKALELVKEN